MTTILTRSQWGARPPKSALDPWPAGQPSGWAVHWAGVPVKQHDHSTCDDNVRADQAYHLSLPEMKDVAYSFLVCQHGFVFEGRGFGFKSAAQAAGNSSLLAVQYHGGPGTPFTPAAKRAIRDLIQKLGPAGARARVVAHREVPGCATACPGDEIAAWVHAGMPVDATAPPTAPPARPVLRLGSRGAVVRALQLALAKRGARLAADGEFGPRTELAVRGFQAWANRYGAKLAVDGVVGPQTWAALRRFGAL